MPRSPRVNAALAAVDAPSAQPAAAQHTDPQIPLPHTNKPTTPLFNNAVEGLQVAGIISRAEQVALCELYRTSKLEASHQMLATWSAADQAGRGVGLLNTTFSPPAQFALQRSSFRTDIFRFLIGPEQPESTDWIVNGFSRGFPLFRRAGWTPVVFPNFPVLDSDQQREFDAFIKDEGPNGLGFICPPPPDWDVSKCQFNPSFLLPKKQSGVKTGGHRKITDLSFSRDGYESVNDGIPRHLVSVHYPSVQDLTDRIGQLRTEYSVRFGSAPVIALGKSDIVKAYRQVPADPADWPSLMSTDRHGNPFIDSRMQMGLAPAARIFCSINMVQSWLLEHVFGAINLPYLDDVAQIAVGASQAEADRNSRLTLEIVRMWYALVGLPTAPKKDECAKQIMTFTGVEVNLVTNSVALPQPKLERVMALLELWNGKAKATVHEVQVLTGVLCDVCRVVPQGKVFLNRLFALLHYSESRQATARNPHFYQVDIGWRQRADIEFFRKLLPVLNGSRRFFSPGEPQRAVVRAGGDASDTSIAGVVHSRVWALWSTWRSIAPRLQCAKCWSSASIVAILGESGQGRM